MTPAVYYRGRRRAPRPVCFGVSPVYIVYGRRPGATRPLPAAPAAVDVGGYQWGCGTAAAVELAAALLYDHRRRRPEQAAEGEAAEFTRRVVRYLPDSFELFPAVLDGFVRRAACSSERGWRTWLGGFMRRGLIRAAAAL